jgi:hypothetical protein
MELNEKTIISKCGFSGPTCINNRFFYTKHGFEIIEHQGDYQIAVKNELCGKGKPIETVEELNNLYNNWVQQKIQFHEKQLKKYKSFL